jgi:hypothetical protein
MRCLVLGVLILLLCPLWAQATCSGQCVQSITSWNGSSNTTLDVALNSNVTSGNYVLGGCRWFNASSGSIAQQSGTATLGTGVSVDTFADSGVAGGLTWYAPVTGSGSLTLRLTLGTASAIGCIYQEVSGIAAASPLDQHEAHGPFTVGMGADAASSCAASCPDLTLASGDYVFGYIVDEQQNVSTMSAGTNFTLDQSQAFADWSEYLVTSASGTQAATFSPPGFMHAWVAMLALKAPAGGSTAHTLTLIGVGP